MKTKLFAILFLMMTMTAVLSHAQESTPTPSPSATPTALATAAPDASTDAWSPPAWIVDALPTVEKLIVAKFPKAGPAIILAGKIIGFVGVALTLLSGFLAGFSGALQAAGVAAGYLDWALKVKAVMDKVIYYTKWASLANAKKPPNV